MTLTTLRPRREMLVVGDVMLDVYLDGRVDRISPEAPVPILSDAREERRPGGAANVAVQLAALGWDVVLVGAVGSDAAGEHLEQLLRERGVRTCLVAERGRGTTVKTRLIADGHHLLRVDTGSESSVNPQTTQAIAEIVRSLTPAAVVISDYSKGVVSQPVASACAKAQAPVITDSKRKHLAIFRDCASVLTSNELEVVAASKRRSLHAAVAAVRRTLPKTALLVTRGPSGMLLSMQGDRLATLATTVRDVVDVTGAGDIVTAFVAHGLAQGSTLTSAAQLANAAAGLGVQRLGAAVVTLPEATLAAATSPDWTPLASLEEIA